MNKRIEDITRQAIATVMNGPDPDGDVEKMYIPNAFAKEFAAMIIQECLLAIEPNIMASKEAYLVEQKLYDRTAEKINKYFGKL